ncbi:thiol-disulfide oxidoreductase DCC family protein [Thalassotalea sp. ND16A]|uniref:thiol-disulfide oxidoreductase DCC family protein n=1 Tax=Thalassotalea sp. ND16A TaxID=1535422 RepID=UPI00051A5CF4|nr:DCC1-like thiol-disulfide oxidoreductase family protein [Thalassotalea sp. ND16A]KGJ95833.1 hypothetical protein ND16A_1368 [Thalassotalea sp. ND16A]
MTRQCDTETNLILFDGVCKFCNSWVRFICRRDPKKLYRFATLQSKTGKRLLAQYALAETLESVILISEGKAFNKSSAALKITQKLSGLWPVLSVLRLCPAPLRDLAYDFVGTRRYRWFGKNAQCPVPDADIRERFLD